MPRVPTPPELPATPPPAEVPEVPTAPVLAKGTQDLADRVPSEVVVEPTPLPRGSAEPDDRALIAHDVRAPLAIILLEAEALAARLADDHAHASVERIAHNVRYIDRLIVDLLDLGSLGHRELRLQLGRVDLATLVRAVIDRAVAARDAGLVELRSCGSAIVRGDRRRLERVIANLLDNALKHGGAHAPVTVTLEVSRGRARLTIADRGPGLTADEARVVFDRYRRGAAAATAGRPGHGLGLYLCRKLIDAHGGRIGVITAPGQGAQFFIELAAAT